MDAHRPAISGSDGRKKCLLLPNAQLVWGPVFVHPQNAPDAGARLIEAGSRQADAHCPLCLAKRSLNQA